jgi:hypothetical protein
LHKVAFFNSSIEIFELILNEYPAAASVKDKNGNLPMHLACLSAGGPLDERKLRMWLGAYPGALSIRNNHGHLPLQMFNKPQEMSIEDYK